MSRSDGWITARPYPAGGRIGPGRRPAARGRRPGRPIPSASTQELLG